MDLPVRLSRRVASMPGPSIRQVFEAGAAVPDKIDLSIGQPDFAVPPALRAAAVGAIESGRNGYTSARGIAELRAAVARRLEADVGWRVSDLPGHADSSAAVFITSGTAGALVLAALAMLDPGDEVVIPDPWFVVYPAMAAITGARAVACPTYPDFRLTAERVEPLVTARTKMVVLNSPGNPSGVVSTERECRDLLDLCRRRGLVLLSDEIYDEFTYPESRTQPTAADPARRRCPSPARLPGAEEHVLLVRGFGKTYGLTGWRLGYAAGPRRLIEEMVELQQSVYVNAPHPLQWGVLGALDLDMSGHVREYERRRRLVVERLGAVTEVAAPGGAFYAFARVPERLGFPPEEAGERFFRRCLDAKVLVVPGRVFSSRDSHFRVSFATPVETLERGLDTLVRLMTA